MAVRNFYVEALIDGRQSTLGGGPKSKQGEMSVHIYQRNEGEIDEALMIDCDEQDGILITRVYDKNHNLLFSHTTKR